MKKTLAKLLILLLLSSVHAEVRIVEATGWHLPYCSHDKRYYCVKGEAAPFTGIFIDTGSNSKHSEKSYKNGLQHGMSKDYYDNGSKFKETNFKYNKKNGRQALWYKNGNLKQIINWKDDQKHGKETAWWRKNNTKKQEINWKSGQKSGLEIKWSKKGEERYQKFHKVKQKNIPKLNTDQYGIMYALNPKRLYTGQNTTKYPNGKKLAITSYKNGLKDGIFTRYSKIGRVKEKTNYKKGKKHGAHESWYDNGNKMRVATYMDGKLHGLLTNWHSQDPIKSIETNYENGKKHGLEKSWHENGSKKLEGYYALGVINSKDIKMWDQEGKKIKYKPKLKISDYNPSTVIFIGNQGYISITQDGVIDLLKKEAEEGKASSQYSIGINHLGSGEYYHEQNLKKARYWLEKAANQGHTAAKSELEKMGWR